MLRASLRNLLAHKLRLALTALSIVLAVAFRHFAFGDLLDQLPLVIHIGFFAGEAHRSTTFTRRPLRDDRYSTTLGTAK